MYLNTLNMFLYQFYLHENQCCYYNEFVPSFYWCSCHSCWSVTCLSARSSVLRNFARTYNPPLNAPFVLYWFMFYSLFIFIYLNWCPTQFSYQMMFLSYKSNTTGVASETGSTYAFVASKFTSFCRLIRLAQYIVICVVFCRYKSLFIFCPFLMSPPWLGWSLYNICVTNDHGYVPLVANTSRSFPHSRLITGFVTRLIWWVLLVEEELITLP